MSTIPIFEELFFQSPSSRYLRPYTYRPATGVRAVIRNGNRTHHVGRYASRLNQAMVAWESTLERDACVIFEGDRDVRGYRSQPIKIQIEIAFRKRNVYPDFELETPTGQIWVDVKFAEQARKQKFRARREALEERASAFGKSYMVMTEKDIRTQRLDNTRWLLSMTHGMPDESVEQTTWEWFNKQSRPRKLPTLFRELRPYPTVRAAMAGLILDGFTELNLDKPMNNQLVTPVEED